MINLKIRINVDEQTLTLPVDTQFVPGIPEKDPVVMVTEITEPEELKYLERDEWNIEELNFLAKRMESFDKREQSQFDAAVSIFRPKTVEALINYTYNLPRFTLISDFSTPNAIGVSHILNRKQVMSLDEMASTDFAKIGKELMQSGKGITTPYGVLFVNEDIPFEPVYDGRHFPEYDYKGSLATVAVSRKGETEYLYLPCSIQDINHALSKLPAKTWGECECSLESSNFPAEDWSENSKSILANEGVYCLNNTCEALQRLYDKSDFEKLSAAMQMADVDDSESIVVLANQLNNFIYIPMRMTATTRIPHVTTAHIIARSVAPVRERRTIVMNKIFRVLGRKGNTTVPFAIRIKSRFKPGDVISYEIKDADTLILHREKVCDHCTDVREKPKEASLLDVINSLSASEQKAVLRYLANRISSGEDF